jgi:hypothetical protein
MNAKSASTPFAVALAWPRALRTLLVEHPSLPAPFRDELESGRLALRVAERLAPRANAAERPELFAVALVNARAALASLSAATRHLPAEMRAEPAPSTQRALATAPAGAAETRAPERELAALLEHARAALAALDAPFARERAARRLAWARALVVPVTLVALLVAALDWRFGSRELSRGKSWTTSSSGYLCDPQRSLCGGAHTKILFHTQEENEPWFELDLGGVYPIDRIAVRNRRDYCPECALPLVVEASVDHRSYRAVAHKFTLFDDWQQSFTPVEARYVRLRVTRRSRLHLERVRVYGRPE